MAASKYDFSIEQGTSFRLSFIYKNASGVAQDLSGWCARITWVTNSGSTQEFSSDTTNSVYSLDVDGLNGKVTFNLPAETTNNFNFYSAKYDIELQSPDEIYVGGGKYTTRILYGVVSIIKRFSNTSDKLEC